MNLGYIIEDEIFKDAYLFLEENKKILEEFSDFCNVGGGAVQIHLKQAGANKIYFRETTDIDILTEERMKKSDFHEFLEKVKRFDYEDFSIDSRITRSFFEISVENGKDAIYIHIPYFTAKRFEKNKEWIKETVKNAQSSNLTSIPVENIRNITKNKNRRSLYHLKKLGYPVNYFDNLVEEMSKLIEKDPIMAKSIYHDKKQEAVNILEMDEFYSKRAQNAIRWAKIYKDAYDIAALKKFYPYYF